MARDQKPTPVNPDGNVSGEIQTRWVVVDPQRPDQEAVEDAAAVLREGGLVAFPTETVYGLGANAWSPAAVEKIFVAKGRPADNPLIVHVAEPAQAAALAAEWSETARKAAQAFWPGPLTLVVPLGAPLPPRVTAGLNTVAVRVPAHPVALALLRAAALPVAAPSANRSGRPSPTRAEHVWDDLAGRIHFLLDGGPVGVGVESTVLDLSVHPPLVLRPGGISLEALRDVLGNVELDPALASFRSGEGMEQQVPRSPGVKYRHYAPACPAVLVEGPPPVRRRKLAQWVQARLAEGRRVGVIATEEGASGLREHEGLILRVTGSQRDPEAYAKGLFRFLRELEGAGCDMIIMEGIEAEGIGLAVMDRLRKAAGGHIVGEGEGVDSPSHPEDERVGHP